MTKQKPKKKRLSTPGITEHLTPVETCAVRRTRVVSDQPRVRYSLPSSGVSNFPRAIHTEVPRFPGWFDVPRVLRSWDV